MDDTPSTSKRRWNEGDTEEEELSLGNTRNVKRKPRGERQSTRGGRQSGSSSASSSREPSINRTRPNIPVPNRSADDIFAIPRATWPSQQDRSESDIQSEGSQSTRGGRGRQSGRMTDEYRRRRDVERKKLTRLNETPEQREKRKKVDKDRKKMNRAMERGMRTGVYPRYDEVTTPSSAATSRDPSEERGLVPIEEALGLEPGLLSSGQWFVEEADLVPIEDWVAQEPDLVPLEKFVSMELEQPSRPSTKAERKYAARQIESDTAREARLQAERERAAGRIANETTEQRRSRLDDQLGRTEIQRSMETVEQQVARIQADIARRREREREEDLADRRRREDAARRQRSRNALRNADSSDSEDGEDHIQSPQTVDPLDIGPRWTCPDCGAQIFGKEKFCCNGGQNVIPPEQRPPSPIDELLYGNGPDAKELKRKILNYGSALGMASLQRKNEPVSAHGLPVAKVQGAIDAYPSTAFPYGDNQEAFGNIFVYEGKEATEMRLKYGHNLNKKLLERIQPALDKYNTLGHQYRNMKEVMDDLNPNDPNEKSSNVRLKIINAWHVDASKLQGHKGIYRTENQDSKDYIAVFYRASVEQGDIDLPGLIVYPYRSRNVMMPINYWDPLVEPLCYTLLRPYGEYGFVPKRYPKKSEKINYWRWLADWLIANPGQGKKSDLKVTPEEIFRQAQML